MNKTTIKYYDLIVTGDGSTKLELIDEFENKPARSKVMVDAIRRAYVHLEAIMNDYEGYYIEISRMRAESIQRWLDDYKEFTE